MVLRIAGLPVWVGPSEMISGARAVLGWTDDAVDVVAALPARISRLLDVVEELVGRVDVLVTRIEPLVGRVDGVADDAATLVTKVDGVAGGAARLVDEVGGVADRAAGLVEKVDEVAGGAAGLVTQAGGVADRADGLVTRADGLASTAGGLLDTYRPVAERAAPLARRFVEEFSEDELTAAIRMVDQLPALTQHLVSDIMPILATLDRVGPDVHELLDQLHEIRQAINGIPGFKLLRRRGEEAENDQ